MGEEGDDMETGKMFDWDQSMAQGFTQVSINLRRTPELALGYSREPADITNHIHNYVTLMSH